MPRTASEPRPHGVLFDAGGTLVRVNRERLEAALRSRGHEAADLEGAFWRTAVLLDSEFAPGVAFESWWLDWQSRLAEHAEVPVAVMHEAYAECDAEWFLWEEPIEGAAACLTRLREAGVRVGVVSNADGRIAHALERAGLADLLEVIVDSGVVGVEKPDPAIFAHALEPLGLAASQTWYLGDTVHYDAAAAEAAGMTSWIIDHGGLHTIPHPRRVTSLAEFADVVLARAV
ncbi:hypothetical protein BH20ACT8_BH20ACT8_00400 [soil metagenome]